MAAAAKEDLKILEQGVETWNKWRKENPKVAPEFSWANLNKAQLGGANLRKASLFMAHLREANLREADLREADLRQSEFYEADLHGADFRGAHVRLCDFIGADLSNAKLTGVKLGGANFTGANLRQAEFEAAYLYRADLRRAKLEKANLADADLRYCNLSESDLTNAILTGVKLYGTARDDWIINDVECKYVYWDHEGKQRSPKDRDLEPGEFERLYAALPTIEYIFENGMTPIDPLIMDRVVQAIREKQPEFDIKIDSINARGLAPSIKFTVQHEEHKEPALEEVRKGYDERINRLDSEKERLYQLLGQAIDKAGEVRLVTGGIVAMDNATINIEQNIHNALELQKAISDEPEESESFAKMAKKTALDIIGGAIKDIAKGQVKEAAKQIIELGKDLGPIIAKTAAYAFFGRM